MGTLKILFIIAKFTVIKYELLLCRSNIICVRLKCRKLYNANENNQKTKMNRKTYHVYSLENSA